MLQISAAEIAKALGGRGRSRGVWLPCTCPICQGEDKLGIKDTDAGVAVNCFKLCRRADILAELDRRGLFSSAVISPVAEQTTKWHAREAAETARRIAEARDFLSECQPWSITGQIARYLSSRGIDPGLIPDTLMWHGMLRHPEGGERPAMVGVIEHVEHGIIGVSRTYLATDGSQKASFRKPRLFVGLAAGGAVRLGPVRPHVELIVGEGIESTLAYMQLRGLPGWAALSAGGIKNLVLPSEARRVVIAADNDLSGVGWRAALAAARRWVFERRQVRIDMPALPGSDWNDALMFS